MSLSKLLKSVDKGEILIPLLCRHLKEREKTQSRKKTTIMDALATIACFKARIREFNHGEEIKGEMYHPSALGQCLRKVYFQVKDAPRDTAVAGDFQELLKRHMTFETGTYMHVIVQNLCESAGILLRREVSIIDRMHKVIGHCDATLEIEGEKYVLEFKSIGSNGYIRLSEPKPEHKAQAHAYMRSLNLKKAIILYCNKDNGQMKEYVVEFDEEFYAKWVRDRIDLYFSKLRRNIIPDREGDNPRSFPCLYCEFTRVCFESGYAERWKKTLSKERAAKMH